MNRTLIIGATSDIAKSVSYDLASRGIKLIVAGRNMEALTLLVNDIILRYEVEVSAKYIDALDCGHHQQFIDDCVQQCGPIDGVFLAYGFMGDQREAETNYDVARRIMDTNYTSVVSLLNVVANYMESKKEGFICAVSSVAGDRGRQSNYIYGSSKGALSIYLQGLRNRLSKSNVHVITIKPGFVDTKMTHGLLKDSPLVSKPDTIAKLIYKAILKRKDVVYTPHYWFFIMLIIKSIPEKIFKRLKL
jgi:decaprenylphospho-beta-D-erythro-pentofuranosid-2-ulose 2-reductase